MQAACIATLERNICMSHPEDVKKKVTQAAEATQDAVKDATEAARTSAKEFAHETQSAAKDAYQTTRDAASNAFDKAQDGLRAVEKELSPAIDDLTARAQAFCSKSIDFCAENSDRARRQFQQTAESTTRYVVEQPGKSILMAAAAGAAVAAAFLMGRRR